MKCAVTTQLRLLCCCPAKSWSPPPRILYGRPCPDSICSMVHFQFHWHNNLLSFMTQSPPLQWIPSSLTVTLIPTDGNVTCIYILSHSLAESLYSESSSWISVSSLSFTLENLCGWKIGYFLFLIWDHTKDVGLLNLKWTFNFNRWF